MALSYPLATPTSIGIESIELRAVNAVAVSQSPFTYKQQIVSHGGQKWEASINIPSVHKPFRGLVGDFRIYRAAITAERVAKLFEEHGQMNQGSQ